MDLLSTASSLGYKVDHLPLIYLRLPLGGYTKLSSFWQPVLDKVQIKLDKWKRFNLSRGGRATLYKSALLNIPTYYTSTFLLPEGVSSKLERILRNFFWEGHKGSKLSHLVNWKMVNKSSLDGGLGPLK